MTAAGIDPRYEDTPLTVDGLAAAIVRWRFLPLAVWSTVWCHIWWTLSGQHPIDANADPPPGWVPILAGLGTLYVLAWAWVRSTDGAGNLRDDRSGIYLGWIALWFTFLLAGAGILWWPSVSLWTLHGIAAGTTVFLLSRLLRVLADNKLGIERRVQSVQSIIFTGKGLFHTTLLGLATGWYITNLPRFAGSIARHANGAALPADIDPRAFLFITAAIGVYYLWYVFRLISKASAF